MKKNKKTKDTTNGATTKGKKNKKDNKGRSQKKKTKKGTAIGGATKITPHCTTCRSAGHDKRTCPGNTKDTSRGKETMSMERMVDSTF